MNVNSYTYYYFIGIGGIGMSALARYFLSINKSVLGYDKTATTLTQSLLDSGIPIIFKDDISFIPSEITSKNTLVIYTPAVKELGILDHFKENNYTILKRSETLGKITQQTQCIAIAGTHGKTTTTTLLAHLLDYAEFPSMAFLGGIAENYTTNFLSKGTQYSVVEADEFDRSFLTLSPYFSCITSTDSDHLDIYNTSENIQKAFQEFASLVSNEGKLFLRKGLPIQANAITYSVEEEADYYATSIVQKTPYSTFDLQTPHKCIKGFEIQLQGKHNIENATVALAMALELGIEETILQQALKEFKGIKRRFTINYLPSGKVYIDDYAHHPTEIRAALQTLHDLFPTQKKLVVFQPHLYSRTQDFAQDFAQSLAKEENLLLIDIYPAREKPIEGVTSEWLGSLMPKIPKVCNLENALEEISSYDFEVLITLGAGNIDTLSQPIIEKLSYEN